MSDLLPCPFCGGQPSVRDHLGQSFWSHSVVTRTTVRCSNCDISFSSEPGLGPEASAAWNRRVYFKRDSLARHLAALDGIRLRDIRSTVGPAEDANNWREYLGRAGDLLAALSADMASAPPHHSTERVTG